MLLQLRANPSPVFLGNGMLSFLYGILLRLVLKGVVNLSLKRLSILSYRDQPEVVQKLALFGRSPRISKEVKGNGDYQHFLNLP